MPEVVAADSRHLFSPSPLLNGLRDRQHVDRASARRKSIANHRDVEVPHLLTSHGQQLCRHHNFAWLVRFEHPRRHRPKLLLGLLRPYVSPSFVRKCLLDGFRFVGFAFDPCPQSRQCFAWSIVRRRSSLTKLMSRLPFNKTPSLLTVE